jgi:phage/plasmid primase-like uncharacterized protein
MCLIVPVMDGQDMISLHYYPPDEGQKKLYLEGARGKGGYFILGEVKKRLRLATGFATAATVREETGEAVAVMFGDDNIMAVAKALRALHPDVEFTICADDDWTREGNPAVKKATGAAKATGSKLAIPTFIEELRQAKHTDFNDMRIMLGGEKVRERLAAAQFCIDSWEGAPELDPAKRAAHQEEQEGADQPPEDGASPDADALRRKREERRRRIIERAAWERDQTRVLRPIRHGEDRPRLHEGAGWQRNPDMDCRAIPCREQGERSARQGLGASHRVGRRRSPGP